MKNIKKRVWITVGMDSLHAEMLLELLKGKRTKWAMQIKKSVKTRLESASWKTTGKFGTCGASLP